MEKQPAFRGFPSGSDLYSWRVCFSSVQSLSRVRLFSTPWTAARQASLSITNSRSLLKLMLITSVMPSSHLIFCRPFLLPPSILPRIRVFSSASASSTVWKCSGGLAARPQLTLCQSCPPAALSPGALPWSHTSLSGRFTAVTTAASCGLCQN